MRDFRSYTNNRDLTIYAEGAFHYLEKNRINSRVFFESIRANPEVIGMEPGKAVEELGDWVKINESMWGNAKKGWNAYWGNNTGKQYRQLEKQYNYLINLQKNDPEEFNARYGQEDIDRLYQLGVQAQAAKKTSWGAATDAFGQGRRDDAAAAKKAKHDKYQAAIQNSLGMGKQPQVSMAATNTTTQAPMAQAQQRQNSYAPPGADWSGASDEEGLEPLNPRQKQKPNNYSALNAGNQFDMQRQWQHTTPTSSESSTIQQIVQHLKETIRKAPDGQDGWEYVKPRLDGIIQYMTQQTQA